MASSIKRIHGADSFSQNNAGEFSHSIKPDGAADYDLGTADKEWRNVFLTNAVKMGGSQDVHLTRVSAKGLDLTADNGTGSTPFEFRSTAQLVISSSSGVAFSSNKQTAAPAGILFASGSSSYSTFISNFGAGNQSILDAINSIAAGGSREKEVVEVTATVTTVSFSSVSGFEALTPAQLDVYVNGLLQRSGSGQDYVVNGNASLLFGFNLEDDDIVQIVKP